MKFSTLIGLYIACLCFTGDFVSALDSNETATPGENEPDNQNNFDQSIALLKSLQNSAMNLTQDVNQYIADNPPTIANIEIVYKCVNPTTRLTSTISIKDPTLDNKIDCEKKIAFIIHGWNNNADDNAQGWTKQMAEKIAYYQDTNACAVHWSTTPPSEDFSSTYVASRHVATVTTYLIQHMLNVSCIETNDVTLIGHSLGAHIAGYIGSNLNGKIPRIFGLDPAGPGFTVPFVVDPSWRLDTSDAQLVVAIHSCDPVLGISKNVGHQEVFINKGECFSQKGCGPTNYIEAAHPEIFTCAHFRAVQFMDDSIDKKTEEDKCVMIECETVEKYEQKACLAQKEIFGYNTGGSHGKFYLSYDSQPQCTGKFYMDE